MKLSIVTINYNNAEGLRRTLESIAAQTYHEIEHVIIDGASTDNSVEVIKDYVRRFEIGNLKLENVIWLSERDNGIYNAMNKGIEIALGRRIVNSFNRSKLVEDKNKALPDYIQILNSGDMLAAPDVVERMMDALEKAIDNRCIDDRSIGVPILYGNMIKKDYATGNVIGKSGEVEYSLWNYFVSTMNHDCCYIRRDLFEKYGLYDESLKIVSDWKWFLQAIGLGKVKPLYVDIDVTIFDVSGISETNRELLRMEKRRVLQELLPPAVYADYDAHAFYIDQMNRLRKHHMYGLVYFIERVLFKFEKWGLLK